MPLRFSRGTRVAEYKPANSAEGASLSGQRVHSRFFCFTVPVRNLLYKINPRIFYGKTHSQGCRLGSWPKIKIGLIVMPVLVQQTVQCLLVKIAVTEVSVVKNFQELSLPVVQLSFSQKQFTGTLSSCISWILPKICSATFPDPLSTISASPEMSLRILLAWIVLIPNFAFWILPLATSVSYKFLQKVKIPFGQHWGWLVLST